MIEFSLPTCRLLLAICWLLLLRLQLQLLQVVGRSAQWVQAPTSHQLCAKYVWAELNERVGYRPKKYNM